MIPLEAKEQLYDCPFCGREGWTRRGLRAHWCRALAKNGETSRPLTGPQWHQAIKRQDAQRTHAALQVVDGMGEGQHEGGHVA